MINSFLEAKICKQLFLVFAQTPRIFGYLYSPPLNIL